MKSIVSINNLILNCVIGINPEERTRKQDVIIDIEIRVNINKAADSADINDCVNYFEVKQIVTNLFDKAEFLLLEEAVCATWNLLNHLCFTIEGCKKISVKVGKPEALDGNGCPSLFYEKKCEEPQSPIFSNRTLTIEFNKKNYYLNGKKLRS